MKLFIEIISVNYFTVLMFNFNESEITKMKSPKVCGMQ